MEINFIFQVNSFHRFKRENPLSANAQALWVELFGLFNARRFPEEMPVSTTHLCAILGLSKDTVLRARKELTEDQLISVERGASGRAASVVKMIYFKKDCGQTCGEPVDNTEKFVDKSMRADGNVANMDANCDTTTDGNFASQESTQTATHKEFCVANMDANCDTYTNLNGVTPNQNVYTKVPSSYPSYQHRGDGCDGKGQFETMEKGRERVLEQLGIRESELEDDNPEDVILRGIVELMAQVYAQTGGDVPIGGRKLSVETVKGVFARLTPDHIRYVTDSLKNVSAPIRNPKSYLLTSLYNAPCTMPYALKADYELTMRAPVSPAGTGTRCCGIRRRTGEKATKRQSSILTTKCNKGTVQDGNGAEKQKPRHLQAQGLSGDA